MKNDAGVTIVRIDGAVRAHPLWIRMLCNVTMKQLQKRALLCNPVQLLERSSKTVRDPSIASHILYQRAKSSERVLRATEVPKTIELSTRVHEAWRRMPMTCQEKVDVRRSVQGLSTFDAS